MATIELQLCTDCDYFQSLSLHPLSTHEPHYSRCLGCCTHPKMLTRVSPIYAWQPFAQPGVYIPYALISVSPERPETPDCCPLEDDE